VVEKDQAAVNSALKESGVAAALVRVSRPNHIFPGGDSNSVRSWIFLSSQEFFYEYHRKYS
jgi:hypothetical protein